MPKTQNKAQTLRGGYWAEVKSMNIKDYLKDNFLLFDGAMGTYYAARNRAALRSCEEANLADPDEIEAIHRAYREAGCSAIKTNTFAANRPHLGEAHCAAVIRAGYEIALRAAGDAFVFADIGPIDSSEDTLVEEYRFVVDQFLALGAKNYLFETNSHDHGLDLIAAYIKEQIPDSFILVSFASQPDGFTRSGHLVTELFGKAALDENIDAVGLNCISGAKHMVELVDTLEHYDTLLSVMPNAGYPTVRDNRTFYDSDPEYFAMQMAELRTRGARILGGCCGTTPAYIAAASRALENASPAKVSRLVRALPPQAPEISENRFWDALCDPNRKPFAVELDSPENADITKFMKGARELQENGAAIITIADCPIARARMDSSLMACKLRRELDMEALPHMTCRDRNLNATQALLLGLCAEDVKNVLIITGDPIPSASRDEVKSVYNFNSRKLIRYVDSLNRSLLPAPFRIFGALNLNVRNFHVELKLAQEKEENGACGFFTQPVLTAQALENLKLARQTLKGKIMGGIIPVVSHKNALFMNSEISGITVDEQIVRLYEGLDRGQGEELAVTISAAIAREIAPYVDGFYLMTPFGRTNLMARIMARIREAGLA